MEPTDAALDYNVSRLEQQLEQLERLQHWQNKVPKRKLQKQRQQKSQRQDQQHQRQKQHQQQQKNQEYHEYQERQMQQEVQLQNWTQLQGFKKQLKTWQQGTQSNNNNYRSSGYQSSVFPHEQILPILSLKNQPSTIHTSVEGSSIDMILQTPSEVLLSQPTAPSPPPTPPSIATVNNNYNILFENGQKHNIILENGRKHNIILENGQERKSLQMKHSHPQQLRQISLNSNIPQGMTYRHSQKFAGEQTPRASHLENYNHHATVNNCLQEKNLNQSRSTGNSSSHCIYNPIHHSSNFAAFNGHKSGYYGAHHEAPLSAATPSRNFVFAANQSTIIDDSLPRTIDNSENSILDSVNIQHLEQQQQQQLLLLQQQMKNQHSFHPLNTVGRTHNEPNQNSGLPNCGFIPIGVNKEIAINESTEDWKINPISNIMEDNGDNDAFPIRQQEHEEHPSVSLNVLKTYQTSLGSTNNRFSVQEKLSNSDSFAHENNTTTMIKTGVSTGTNSLIKNNIIANKLESQSLRSSLYPNEVHIENSCSYRLKNSSGIKEFIGDDNIINIRTNSFENATEESTYLSRGNTSSAHGRKKSAFILEVETPSSSNSSNFPIRAEMADAKNSRSYDVSPMMRMRNLEAQQAVEIKSSLSTLSTNNSCSSSSGHMIEEDIRLHKQRKWKHQMKLAEQQRKQEEMKLMQDDSEDEPCRYDSFSSSNSIRRKKIGDEAHCHSGLSSFFSLVQGNNVTKIFDRFIEHRCGNVDNAEATELDFYDHSLNQVNNTFALNSNDTQKNLMSPTTKKQPGESNESKNKSRNEIEINNENISTLSSGRSSNGSDNSLSKPDRNRNEIYSSQESATNPKLVEFDAKYRTNTISAAANNTISTAANNTINTASNSDGASPIPNAISSTSINGLGSRLEHLKSSFSSWEENKTNRNNQIFLKVFISETSSTGLALLWDKEPHTVTFAQPSNVIIYLRLRHKNNKNSSITRNSPCSPQLVWHHILTPSSGSQQLIQEHSKVNTQEVGSIDLFDIASIGISTTLQLQSFPFAIPGRSIFITLHDRSTFFFGSSSEKMARLCIHGIKTAVSRLAYGSIIGNVNICCELFDVARGDINNESSDDNTGSLNRNRNKCRNAVMNDITTHMVFKSGI